MQSWHYSRARGPAELTRFYRVCLQFFFSIYAENHRFHTDAPAVFLSGYLARGQYLRVVEIAEVGTGVDLRPHQGGGQGDGQGAGHLLRALRLGGQAAPPTLEAVRPHHLLHHPHHQALLEAAELATVPSALVHGAVLVRKTDILGVLLDRPLEEALAALAGADAVVLAGGVVTAHGAEQGRGLGLGRWRVRRLGEIFRVGGEYRY